MTSRLDPSALHQPQPERPLPNRGVLRKDAVRIVSQPALVDCSGAHDNAITVVPLMDGDRVAGLEVRCGCGASTLIECVYEPEQSR
jgi:hypothetical protein